MGNDNGGDSKDSELEVPDEVETPDLVLVTESADDLPAENLKG